MHKLDQGVQRTALRKLLILDAAETLDDLRVPPRNRLEKLKGDRGGFYSVRVNQQWRICFRWTSAGPETKPRSRAPSASPSLESTTISANLQAPSREVEHSRVLAHRRRKAQRAAAPGAAAASAPHAVVAAAPAADHKVSAFGFTMRPRSADPGAIRGISSTSERSTLQFCPCRRSPFDSPALTASPRGGTPTSARLLPPSQVTKVPVFLLAARGG